MKQKIKLLLLAFGLSLLATASVHATCPPDPCDENPDAEGCNDGNNGNGGESMPIAVILDDMPTDIFVGE